MIGLYNFFDNITVYGSMIVIGILISGVWSYMIAKKFKMCPENTIIIEAYIVLFALIFAKVLFLLVNNDIIDWSRITDLDYLKQIIGGGFVFLGGFLGGALSLIVVHKIHKIPTLTYIEIMLPGLPFAQCLGRIGCHFAGCCYGIPYNGLFHIVYYNNPLAPNSTPLFPVQLLESMCCLILAIIMGLYVYKNGPKINTVFIYLFGYGTVRFCLEYLRYDDAERGYFGIFSTSQWICIAMIIASIILMIYKNETTHKHKYVKKP